ncbi:DUF5134 domain-containing protein [Nocardia callitridis]|uniref:DUF5134 domain-containing protein n=1 Tax=Nocardia callitridis TaxID=648753 RepID=A0ABP9KFK0_9NOCA
MGDFVLDVEGVRWVVTGAFLLTAAIVMVRVAAPVLSGVAVAGTDHVLATTPAVVERTVRQRDSPERATEHVESDAAHLIMCAAMVAMLVFPTSLSPHAMHGVIVALIVVFSALLALRIAQSYNDVGSGPADRTSTALARRTVRVAQATWRNARCVPLAYHVAAALAMLYAMSGHGAGGLDGAAGGPTWLPASVLAVLFVLDAAVMVSPALRSLVYSRRIVPARGVARMLPHVVMDLGTAYMLLVAIHA